MEAVTEPFTRTLQTPPEAYRAAIGDQRANELYDAAMEALHAFAQHTDAVAGTNIIAWFSEYADRAAEASFAAYREAKALRETAASEPGEP